MDKRLDRIQKLIELATNNPNEEEARSAAMKCVQLLVEHKVFITLPGQQQAPPPPPHYGHQSDIYEAMRRQQEVFQKQRAASEATHADILGNMGNGW